MHFKHEPCRFTPRVVYLGYQDHGKERPCHAPPIFYAKELCAYIYVSRITFIRWAWTVEQTANDRFTPTITAEHLFFLVILRFILKVSGYSRWWWWIDLAHDHVNFDASTLQTKYSMYSMGYVYKSLSKKKKN